MPTEPSVEVGLGEAGEIVNATLDMVCMLDIVCMADVSLSGAIGAWKPVVLGRLIWNLDECSDSSAAVTEGRENDDDVDDAGETWPGTIKLTELLGAEKP